MIILTDKEIVPRREHKCIWCGESINVEENCQFQKVIYDGGVQNNYWHDECYNAVLGTGARCGGEEIDFGEHEGKRGEFAPR